MSAGLGCRCYEECGTEAYHRKASWFVFFFSAYPIFNLVDTFSCTPWSLACLRCFYIVRHPSSHFGILPPLIEWELTGPFSALASQSLSVVSELIPYVRETFRRHLNQAEAVLLVDFDKLKRVRAFGSLRGLPSILPCVRVATTMVRDKLRIALVRLCEDVLLRVLCAIVAATWPPMVCVTKNGRMTRQFAYRKGSSPEGSSRFPFFCVGRPDWICPRFPFWCNVTSVID